MTRHCERLVLPALKSAFENSVQVSSDNGTCRVTVPFDRADQDAIALWIVENGDGYTITDEGETYGMLYLSNVDLEQKRRKKRLESIQKRFNLDQAKYEIKLSASSETLGQRIIDAIQAVQSISYLVYTRRQYTVSDFREEVGEYLSEYGYNYSRNAKIDGKIEQHRVDFDIVADKPAYLEALHAENVSTAHSMAQRTAYKWTDIQKTAPEIIRVSTLDDESGEFDERAANILREYSDEYVPWSERGSLIDTLGSPRSVA